MDPSDWPCFLRPYGQFNPARPLEGLLKSKLMVKTAHAILFSPSAADDPITATTTTQTSGARGHSVKQRATIGIAKTYQLTGVTRLFIAYMAVVLRHALTSDEVFNNVCAGFNYIEFYKQIREFLELPQFEQTTNALVTWWNEQLFSGYRLGLPVVPSTRHALGTLASLEAKQEAAAQEVPPVV